RSPLPLAPRRGPRSDDLHGVLGNAERVGKERRRAGKLFELEALRPDLAGRACQQPPEASADEARGGESVLHARNAELDQQLEWTAGRKSRAGTKALRNLRKRSA